MPPRRIRRPLLALIVLVAAVAIGYGWQATHADSRPAQPPAPAATVLGGSGPPDAVHGAH